MKPSEESLRRLAVNARLGDGCYWKHPECRHWTVCFTGTNKWWLSYKGHLAGKEPALVRAADSQNGGVFRNAKPLWGIKSDASSIFDEYRNKDLFSILQEMDDLDAVHWFLDDGCTIERRDQSRQDGRMSYRYTLCLGDLLKGDLSREIPFLALVQKKWAHVVGNSPGSIGRNNSRATVYNRNWRVPVALGRYWVLKALELAPIGFENKLRYIW